MTEPNITPEQTPVPQAIVRLFENLIIQLDAAYLDMDPERKRMLHQLHVNLIVSDILNSYLAHLVEHKLFASPAFIGACTSLYRNDCACCHLSNCTYRKIA
jgi:hypothetical protein